MNFYVNFTTLRKYRNNTPNNIITTTNGNRKDSTDVRLQARMDECLKQPLDYYYKMNHKNRGLCLIFNHESFLDKSLGLRRGTQVDRDRLHKTFTALDFDVRIFDNPSEVTIRGILKKGMLEFIMRICFDFH